MFTYIFTVLWIFFFTTKEVLTTPSALPYEIALVLCVFLMVFFFRKPAWWKWVILFGLECFMFVVAFQQTDEMSKLDNLRDGFVGVCAMFVFGILFFITLVKCIFFTDREK